ncbi:MAG TPA: hypothetical protein VGO70_01405 [Arsenicitalea sp.]|jgi:hypothetical protein|nr:hypothetical protein [Arsenicitalea sp.]
MRLALIVIGFMLAAFAPGISHAAEKFDTPRAVLEFAYKAYASSEYTDNSKVLYSKGLEALFAADEARTPAGDVGAVDFDVFVNGQDYKLNELTIDDAVISGAKATEAVSFKNFDESESMQFYLVKQQDGWKIDDIESLTPGHTWRLSELLAADPALN